MTDALARSTTEGGRSQWGKARELLRSMVMDIRMDERASTLEDLQRRYTLQKKAYVTPRDLR